MLGSSGNIICLSRYRRGPALYVGDIYRGRAAPQCASSATAGSAIFFIRDGEGCWPIILSVSISVETDIDPGHNDGWRLSECDVEVKAAAAVECRRACASGISRQQRSVALVPEAVLS